MGANGDTNISGGEPAILLRDGGHRVAYHRVRPGVKGKGLPGIVFCSGYRSDMKGTKAIALDEWARANERAYCRFDYFGHGQSSGEFVDGTIGHWRDDTLAVIDQVTEGPQIIVGSSMGGWIALLAALARPERVAGLVLIAPAADFTEALLWNDLDLAARETLSREGVLYEPSHYDTGDYPFTMKLIEEGRQHLILEAGIDLHVPVRILQGMQDPDVPWQHALRTTEALHGTDTVLSLIKDGDHRLSRPQDIERMIAAIEEIVPGA